MSQRAADRIKEGLEQAIAIAKGTADPTAYKVHTFPKPSNAPAKK